MKLTFGCFANRWLRSAIRVSNGGYFDGGRARCGNSFSSSQPSLFLTQGSKNERWLELKEFPQGARPPSRYPPFETLMAERNHLFAKHPHTNFIAAHLAFHGNDLERLGKLFDTLPNMYVDIAAVLAELGRQPYSAHDFLIKYQDPVLIGKEIYVWNEYKWYFRA